MADLRSGVPCFACIDDGLNLLITGGVFTSPPLVTALPIGEAVMERFIHRQNIEHYERLLQTVTDETERKRILKLLEEEKQKTNLDGPPESKRRQV